MARIADVIVIGAGLSGLTTAWSLARRDVDVVVLEAKGRVGGRLKNQHVAGSVVDAGGSWIGPTQRAVCALVEELNMSTFPQHTEGDNLLIANGRTRRFRGETPPLGRWATVDLGLAMWRLDRAAGRIQGNTAWSGGAAEALDRQTLGAWLQRNTVTEGARFAVELITGAAFGCRADELSLLGFLAHVASAGGLSALAGTRGAAQDRHIVGGAAAMCDELAHRLGARIHLNTPVRMIDQSQDFAQISTAAEQFSAKRVVLAVDPATASRIEHQPDLPARRHTLERTFAMGTGIKAHLSYPRPFWRGAGLSGFSCADNGAAPMTFDVSPPDGAGILMIFTNLDGSAERRRAAVVDELATRFGDQARAPTDYAEQNWAHESFQSGCVPRCSPGVITAAQDAFTRPVGVLHFAGAETSTIWEGHMEGAVRSAERVVSELVRALLLPAAAAPTR